MSNALPHANADLLHTLPDEGPVVMVNLVKLRETSRDGNGTGWDAYQRYSRAVVRLLRERQASIIWAGDVDGLALGHSHWSGWDYVVLVRYPSRAIFLEMMQSEAYAAANRERENALADHVILAATERFRKFEEI